MKEWKNFSSEDKLAKLKKLEELKTTNGITDITIQSVEQNILLL